MRPAEHVPDLTREILAAARPPARRSPAVGRHASPSPGWPIVQLALALPALLLGEGAGVAPHVARHLGSFDVAIAIGLLVAAWRPERAGPSSPSPWCSAPAWR